jgi:mono/diheme cytochrome c family protein
LFADVDAPWNAMMAAAIIYVLPPIALLFALRRRLAAGLAMGEAFHEQDRPRRRNSRRSHWRNGGVRRSATIGSSPVGPMLRHESVASAGHDGAGMVGQGMTGSMPRHHAAMMSGIPAPYNSLSNPLPRTRETVQRDAAVYEQNCASCHGATGARDGPVGRTLSPPPANLALLAQMPMVQWDPFMYLTVAEGGAQFGSAMPAFKDALSKDDIWAVIAYIQARLSQKAGK